MSTTTLPDSKPPGMSTTEAAEVLRSGGKVQHRDWQPWEWMKIDKDGRFRFHNGGNVCLSADTLEKLEGRVWYIFEEAPAVEEPDTKGTDDASAVLGTMLVALEKLACLGNGDRPGTSDGNLIAQHALKAVRPYFQAGELPPVNEIACPGCSLCDPLLRKAKGNEDLFMPTTETGNGRIPRPRKPTIGRIVHYLTDNVDSLNSIEPGIISGITQDGRAVITTFPSGFLPRQVTASMGGPDGTTPTPGCWTWPPTV